jgi:hypothetical protein
VGKGVKERQLAANPRRFTRIPCLGNLASLQQNMQRETGVRQTSSDRLYRSEIHIHTIKPRNANNQLEAFGDNAEIPPLGW